MTTCPWWLRWLHARRRMADLEVLWPSLVARADSLDAARVAWDVFLGQEGQKHWHCPCGQPIAVLFQTTIITVEE